MPTPDVLDASDLDASREDLEELVRVDPDEGRRELPLIREFFERFGDRPPRGAAAAARRARRAARAGVARRALGAPTPLRRVARGPPASIGALGRAL
jgi:hypothetical protein